MFQQSVFRVQFSVILTVLIIFVVSAIPQQLPCNPFESGTTEEIAEMTAKNAELNPDDCLCTSPCTADKVSPFVRIYYARKGHSYRALNINNPTASELFSYRHSLKFIIHGYTQTALVGWMPPLGHQLAKTFKGYVLLVDYGPISNCSYQKSVEEIVPSVANYVANIIKSFNFDPNKIELIGHSLGGHMVGYIGASFNGVIKRITALDPAGPVYDDLNIGLNRSCAQFVQVLHTSPGFYGTTLLRGDADFFANNRSETQTGCTSKLCSHFRAVYFHYASLIPQNRFIGGDCQLVDSPNLLHTAEFGLPYNGANGVFCFDTNPCYPYTTTISEYQNCRKCKKIKNCNSLNRCKNH